MSCSASWSEISLFLKATKITLHENWHRDFCIFKAGMLAQKRITDNRNRRKRRKLKSKRRRK